ncbi:hypothetical protein [Parafrankia sp. FMc2]|uniref:hypothetical protein n=1 Tax=Parafrankia sp. FMc2 TaxID=3233196 RepID=UPI0034D41947
MTVDATQLLLAAGVYPATHPQTAVAHHGKIAFVDKEIAPLVRGLWRAGISTAWSCQGGSRGKTLAVDNLAYLAFTQPADRHRFAMRLPTRLRPGWQWETDHEVRGGYDVVRFPAADLPWLAVQFT